jgi:hypothetical protein
MNKYYITQKHVYNAYCAQYSNCCTIMAHLKKLYTDRLLINRDLKMILAPPTLWEEKNQNHFPQYL